MGGAVSAGRNNDELVDNLCYEDYISTPAVERAFRMIDRADYMQFEGDDRPKAYEDHAWRRGTLHLSAPCIYSRAMEALELEPGISFLNIGSGTGYLSTMVGLIVGPRGVNHGIEICEDNVGYAYEKLRWFQERSKWYDPARFCEPHFVAGNGLLLGAGSMQYDRIYCGAGCLTEHITLLTNMLKVGGILVVPHENQLEAIRCEGPHQLSTSVVLPNVSFAPLILPSEQSDELQEAVELTAEPHCLKQICRIAILNFLTRQFYSKIHSLPLPPTIQEYVAHYRSWGSVEPPLETLCPIDQTNEAAPCRTAKKPRGDEEGCETPATQSRPVDGVQVLFCSFNGNIFQVPLDNVAYHNNGLRDEEDDEEFHEEGREHREDDHNIQHADDPESDASNVEPKDVEHAPSA